MLKVRQTLLDSSPDPNGEEIARLARSDRHSWWIRGRRVLVRSALKKHRSLSAAEIVGDLGCGAGGMFEVLKEFGTVAGIDISPLAAELCRARGYSGVAMGSLESLPLKGSSLGMISMTDVLEHVEADGKALQECARTLKPGGLLLITVPAYRWLYAEHDKALGHFRRYTRQQIRQLLQGSGFQVERVTYFNMFLLPLAIIHRLKSKVIRGSTPRADTFDRATPWNWLAYQVVAAERFLISLADLPCGLSLLAIARKPRDGVVGDEAEFQSH